MKSFLANSNIVVVANQFNPSVVNQLWLVDHDIVRRHEFLPGCIFSDMMVNVVSDRFTMLVVPEQLQFAPSGDQEQQLNAINDCLGQIVRTIPHTPFVACGMNFVWHIEPEDMESFGRKLFYVESSCLFKEFDDEGSRFGGYMSRPAAGGRLKLDIKPLLVTSEEGCSKEVMHFGFNFHYDLPKEANASQELLEVLTRWNEANELVKSTMDTMKEVVA